ncbi:Protein dopey, partial [Termitomyces sp. T112]
MSSESPTVSSAHGTGKTLTKGSALTSARASERAVAQQAFASDPKYKKFTQQVEKCLNSFDSVHEWADFIAFLKQLLKTFQSYMQFKDIPRKLIVSKRLSQCLNPALPTGVHQRALDVYLHILSVLGPEGLLADLPIWSSGLFPFFEYAATSVKPTLLNLFDTHYLPLQSGLRPVMKSFILALLPGLEEETSEFFDKVLNLLDRLSGTVSPSFFFQNIWLVMLTTPIARGTSLNYLARRLPRLNADEDITEVVGKDIGLMIRAFAAALEDENLLVRRGALDLLLQSLRVDSTAVRKAQVEDRVILMRAATGVVLRRDLSLNRRLYTWLLGSDEKSEHQIEYLKTHVLDLVYSTLKSEMFTPSGEYSESRPFKIFISLLDKWEIGAAISQVLVYDAFKAIENLIDHPSDGGEDVTMTASTLYEAIEPHILWKQLLTVTFSEITGDRNDIEAIRMIQFLLKTFSQDDEIQTIHLPIIFAAILDLIDIRVQGDMSCLSSPLVKEALLLQEEVLRHVPHSALMQRPNLTGPIETKRTTQRPYLFACSFYGVDPIAIPESLSNSFAVPFVSAFENLATITRRCAQKLITSCSDIVVLREVFSLSLLLLDRLSSGLTTSVTLPWNPDDWLQVILKGLEHELANFTTVDRTVSLVMALHQNTNLVPRPLIDNRSTMIKMVTKLLKYLRADYVVYHVRAVNLIWSLEIATTHSHVESIIAQTMTSPESQNINESYEAFGVLWRLTEDNLLPGFRFKVPMMIVLETLKSDDPSLRRIGETWMRCSLRSYLRVLDPILFELLDPTIRRILSVAKVNGREIQIFLYECPFDQRYTNHLLDLLLSIIRFGGQGFAKTTKATTIQRSHHAGLIQRVEACGMFDTNASYLDALVEIVLRFIQSEPNLSWTPTMHPNNVIIQSTAVDLLQAVVARGDVDGITDGIEAIIVGKLYLCVHWHRLDLQNKLLHLLHSLISASTSRDAPSRQAMHRHDGSGPSSASGNDIESEPRQYSVNSLLIQTLVDGIVVRTNRPVLQHWLDFILMAIPQFQPALQAVVNPLNDCFCRQLTLSLKDIHTASSQAQDFARDFSSSVTDAEMIMLLNGLERMILLSLAYTIEPSSTEEESIPQDKAGIENSGLLGYVSNVFGSESTQQITDETLT